jgi:two-component sensor histidine kinase
MLNGWIAYNDYTRYGFLYVSAVEITSFSLIIANNFNMALQKTVKLQKKLLMIQSNHTQELESIIENRTNKLKTALLEKELLLKEVYHRVKNNFHMISSLLWLEAEKMESNDEKDNAFLTMINRIKAMSSVNQLLYNSKNLSTIESGEYLMAIIEETKLIYSKSDVVINHEIETCNLTMDESMILGMIVSEVLNNAIKHHDTKDICVIMLTFKNEAGNITLKIKDNGSGFTLNNKTKAQGLGLKLIKQFSKKLSNSKISFSYENGTLFKLEFQLS